MRDAIEPTLTLLFPPVWLVLISSPPLPTHSSNMVQSALGPKRVGFEKQTQDVDDMARSLPLAPHRFISARETVSFDEDVLFISFCFFLRRGAQTRKTISTPSRLTPPRAPPQHSHRGSPGWHLAHPQKARNAIPSIAYRPKTKERTSYLISPKLRIFIPSPHPPLPITTSSHTPSSARSS